LVAKIQRFRSDAYGRGRANALQTVRETNGQFIYL
jgi:hypothetical protein